MNSNKLNEKLIGIYNIDFDFYINFSSKFDDILINKNKGDLINDTEYINYKNNYIFKCIENKNIYKKLTDEYNTINNNMPIKLYKTKSEETILLNLKNGIKKIYFNQQKIFDNFYNYTYCL